MSLLTLAPMRIHQLVEGYIRMIDIKEQIIPSSIIKLVVIFYHYSCQIAYVYSNHVQGKPASISIAKLHDNTNYQCNVFIKTNIQHI